MTHSRLLRILQRMGLYLFWPAVAFVVWGELTPGAGIAFVPDKVQHFTAYAGLAGMALLATGNRKRAIPIVIGLILMGGILEILQAFTGRDASFWDEAANAAGAAIGAFAAVGLLGFLGQADLQSAAEPGETGRG